MCKKIFAAAHELFHIHRHAEYIDPETITRGSLLNSKIVGDLAVSKEDLEALLNNMEYNSKNELLSDSRE